MNMTLTSKQRAFLNSQAHSLKPIIQIGKNGLNDQIKTSVRQALDARELIKVTLLQNTDENIHEVAEILEEEIGDGYGAEDWPDLDSLQAVQQERKSQTLLK